MVGPVMKLNDGHAMPQLGLGLMRFGAEDMTAEVIARAYDAGYRLFDTAAVYKTEAQTGDGVRALNCQRGDVYVTTKLWNACQGADKADAAIRDSLSEMGFDWLDLYLIHWPLPKRDLYVESWRALIGFREEGLTRSIGVSNFEIDHLQRLIDETGVVPAVNQIEVHPHFQQQELRAFHDEHGIVTQAWSPFGGGGKGRIGATLEDPAIIGIAEKHGRSPAEVVLQWHVASGMSVIPKATSRAHLDANLAALTLKLDDDDMAAIAGLDSAEGRVGPDPAVFDYVG